MLDAEHLRLLNVVLSLVIVARLTFRFTTTWARHLLETPLEAVIRRVRSALLILIFCVASYASVLAWHYEFPVVPSVPILTFAYVGFALSLTVPVAWVERLIRLVTGSD